MSRYRAYICGGDMRPGPRGTDCPDALHDFPLPSGYVDASEEAGSRLNRGWGNPRCGRCGLYGWTPGRPRKGEHLVRVRPELVEELLAAIQEREDAAKAARQQALSDAWLWVVDAGSGDGRVETRKSAVIADGGLFEVGPHIALNDPASVLRLCQAHRGMIELHKPETWEDFSGHDYEPVERLFCRKCAMGESCSCCLDSEDREWPCAEIRILAAGYGIQEDPDD